MARREGACVNPKLTFGVLALGVSAYSLLQSLVLPALPTLQHKLHTSQDTVTWVLTAYLLSASVFTPILGRVGDMVGKGRMFTVTLAALGVGSLLAALATSIDLMIVARVIQGIGGAMLPMAFGIVRDEMPPARVRGLIGAIAALTAVGAGLGVVLGGVIVDTLGYHWLFWFPFILTVIAGISSHFFVPESPVRTPGRINWLAAVLLAGWLVALLVAASEGPTWGWTSTRTIVLFATAVVLLVTWIRVEMRSAEPLIDMRMMRQKAVWTNNLVALMFGVGLYASFAFIPSFVQTSRSHGYGFGSSVATSGLYLAPLAVGMFLTGMLSGPLSQRFGAKPVLVMGASLSVPAFFVLAFAHTHEWEVFGATGLLGIGFGAAFAAMSSLIVDAVPPAQTGVASGMNANIRTIGGSIGAALMASIVTSGVAAGHLPKESGYTYGYATRGAAAALAAIAAVFVPVGRRTTAATPGQGASGEGADVGLDERTIGAGVVAANLGAAGGAE
jgi:EmrB/QacA subfamily drug resistance transporter